MRYLAGEYNEASGTRDAFGAFSNDLVAAGLPEVVVVSGDRAPAVQVRIFVDRYRQQGSGGGAFGDVRYWDGSAWGYPGGTRWVRVSSAGTVAVPGTGNHEKKRSNDLAWPYNAVTTAHLRAREIAKRHNITCDGLGFGEPWHWTYWGPLGDTGRPAGGGSSTERGPLMALSDKQQDDLFRMTAEIHKELVAQEGAGWTRARIFATGDAVDKILRMVTVVYDFMRIKIDALWKWALGRKADEQVEGFPADSKLRDHLNKD